MQTVRKISNSNMLESYGIHTSGSVYQNLDTEALIEHATSSGEARISSTGALACYTGEHTGRSPNDKFIVEDQQTAGTVDWGEVNRPLKPEHFERLRKGQAAYLSENDLYIADAYAGAENTYRLPIRVLNETAWANLFCRQLFRRLTPNELVGHHPEFTIIHTPGFKADPISHGTNSTAFIVVNFSEGLILIGGTKYAGEMKKSIFSVLNYVYPLRGVLPMHCSANVSKTDSNHTALFFGLSGTGKTTLSADPTRRLIGDDEHGWSKNGIFNFEGGCYAKCIHLSQEKEPQIWGAIRKGTILENVVIDEETGVANFDDTSITENTRAAYPLEHISDVVESGTGAHPQHIVFLTCDAFGVMPPISKLNSAQAMYHFLSGYTAKVAGTERGIGNTPQATFSACFGSPFLPLNPTTYAELLGKKMRRHNSQCWLINTGWIGGGVGVGERISLKHTRTIVNAALNGELNNASFEQDPIFGLEIPTHIEGVPDEELKPEQMWGNSVEYKKVARDLAGRFVVNFKQFESYMPELVKAGPVVGR